MGLEPVTLQKLVNKRFFTAKDLVIATHSELVETLDISFQVAEEVVLQVCSQIAPNPLTVSMDCCSGSGCLTEELTLAASTTCLPEKLGKCRSWTFTQGHSSKARTCQHSFLLWISSSGTHDTERLAFPACTVASGLHMSGLSS